MSASVQMNSRGNDLADVFRRQARAHASRIALQSGSDSLTYAMLDERSNRVAQALLREGVGPGDRIGVLSRNCTAFFELLGGVAKVRSSLAPVNVRLAVAEIAYLFSDMAPAVIFVSQEFLATAMDALDGIEKIPRVIVLDARDGETSAYQRWRDAAPAFDPRLEVSADDDVLLLYTSGTTGQPKGVRIKNENYSCVLSAFSQVPGFSYPVGETIATTMPLFHIAGINAGVSGLCQGGKVLPVRDFVPLKFLELIASERVNSAFLAPTMISALLNTAEVTRTDFSSLRMIAYGASPISREVLAQARERFGCDFAQLYGMTESTGAGTYLDPAAHALPHKHGSCGRAWPIMKIRIVDAAGNTVAPGVVGEVLLSGHSIMAGYRGREQATREAIRDGWLHTGDAGYLDEDGDLFIRDRWKDMIVSGGENVFPGEVEDAIADCPGVKEVAVIGIPSERWGEEVKAIVVPADDRTPAPAEIIAWARARIAGYKLPKSVDFVGALPRNAAGKVLKRELRKKYWQGRDRQVN